MHHEIQRLRVAISKLEKANRKWYDKDRAASIARKKAQLERLVEENQNTQFYAS